MATDERVRPAARWDGERPVFARLTALLNTPELLDFQKAVSQFAWGLDG